MVAIDASNTSHAGRRAGIFAFIALLILTDACDGLLYALLESYTRPTSGLPVARGLLLIVFLAAGVLAAGHLRGAADRARAAWFLWPPVALTFVSVLWSDQPGTTLAWSGALLGVSVFGVALAVRFSAADQATLTAGVTFIIALASVLAIWFWPTFGVAASGDWQGLYIHRNLLGRVMALGVVSSFVVALQGDRQTASTPSVWPGLRTYLACIALLLCGGLLLATQSRTATLAASVTVAAAILIRAARVWRRQATAILVGGAATALLTVALLVMTPTGLALMARSGTLSDRTTIWKGVITCARETPWLGHGYGAFWSGPAGQRALALMQLDYPIGHSHNGALDLFAELGIAGLLLVCVPLCMITVAAVRHALEPGDHACLWPATYLVFFVASNAAESALFRHKVYWALYVAAACHVASRRHRLVAENRAAMVQPPGDGSGW